MSILLSDELHDFHTKESIEFFRARYTRKNTVAPNNVSILSAHLIITIALGDFHIEKSTKFFQLLRVQFCYFT